MAALVPNATFQLLPGVLEQVCAGFGAIPLVGTPQQVVEGLVKLADAGLDGAALTWIDYAEGLTQYEQVLLPLLREAGLRA